jgi:thiol-disulfide isomerase/thioredoxin
MSHGKILLIGVAAVAALFIGFGIWNASGSGQYDAFAECLADKGAKFYGAYWCPHCEEQKRLFGNSAGKLPYIECSTPDGKEQLPVCDEALVQSYPTWVLANGERLVGPQSLELLSQKTGCALPS